MSHYDTHITIGDVEEVPVRVFYTHCPLICGARDGRGGLPIEPDEPEHIEIDRIILQDGRDYEPTRRLESALAEEIGDWLNGMYDQEPPEREER